MTLRTAQVTKAATLQAAVRFFIHTHICKTSSRHSASSWDGPKQRLSDPSNCKKTWSVCPGSESEKPLISFKHQALLTTPPQISAKHVLP